MAVKLRKSLLPADHITLTLLDVTVMYIYTCVHTCTYPHARAHKLLYTRVRASGPVVSDLQNTLAWRVWPVCHAGSQPLAEAKHNPMRGVRGGTIANFNLLLIDAKISTRFKDVTKSRKW